MSDRHESRRGQRLVRMDLDDLSRDASPVATAPPPGPPPRPKEDSKKKKDTPVRRGLRRGAALVAFLLVVASVPTLLEVLVPRLLDSVLRKQLGHRLILGRLDLDLWNARLVGHDVVLSPLGESAPSLRADRVELAVALRKIFSGIVVERVEIDGLRAHLDRMPSGSFHLIDAIVKAQRKVVRDASSGPPPDFRIDTISVPDAVIVVTDGLRARREVRIAIQIANLGTLREEGRPGHVWVETRAGGIVEKLAVEGEVDLVRGHSLDFGVRADVTVLGVDTSGVAEIASGFAAEKGSLSLRTRFAARKRTRENGVARIKLAFSDMLLVDTAGGRVGGKLAELDLESVPNEPVTLKRAKFVDSVVPLVRRSDNAITLLGVTLVKPPPEVDPGQMKKEAREVARRIDAAALLGRLQAELFRRGEAGAPVHAAVEKTAPRAEAEPGKLSVPFEEVVLENAEIHVRDRAVTGEPDLALTRCDMLVQQLPAANPGDPRVLLGAFRGELPGVAREVGLSLVGEVGGSAADLSLGFRIAGIRQNALHEYLDAAGGAIGLDEGEVSGRARIRIARRDAVHTRGEIAIDHVLVRDRSGVHATVDELFLPFRIDASGKRASIVVPELALRGWLRVSRTKDALTVAGFSTSSKKSDAPIKAAAAFPKEPAVDLLLEHAVVSGSVHFEDRTTVAMTDAFLELRIDGVGMGEQPRIGKVSFTGSIPGVAPELFAEGRIVASAVVPAAVLSVRVALAPELPNVYLAPAFRADLEGRTLVADVGVGLQPVSPDEPERGRMALLRLRDVALADANGVTAGVGAVLVEAIGLGAQDGVLGIPHVVVSKPYVTVRPAAEGLEIARALVQKANVVAPPAERKDPPARTGSVLVADVRVEDGAVDVVGKAGFVWEILGLRAKLGPLEVGPAAGRRPLALDVEASVPGVAEQIHIAGAVSTPTSDPRVRATIDVGGIDLSLLKSVAPDKVGQVVVTNGRLHAALDAHLRKVSRDGTALGGEVSLRDVSFKDEAGRELGGLGEARVKIDRLGDGAVAIAWLGLDRPRIDIVRQHDGSLRVLGIVSSEKILALTDEERHLKELGLLPEPAPEAAPVSTAEGGSRVTIDRFTVADASVLVRDEGAIDENGRPFVLQATNIDATGGDVSLGGVARVPMTFEVEARFLDGERLAADGHLRRTPSGWDGHVEVDVRGVDVRPISRYAENAANVRLIQGELAIAAQIALRSSVPSGDVEIVAHRLQLRQLADNVFQRVGTRVGAIGALGLITDFEGDTTVVIPIDEKRVDTPFFVGHLLREIVVNVAQQPLKLIMKPIELGTGRRVGDLINELFLGERLKAPVSVDAAFAPGDVRLTKEAAEAVVAAKALMEKGGRQVRLRAECSPGDRARAVRLAVLQPDELRALAQRMEGERRIREDERRDLASSERVALARGDLDEASKVRGRLHAVDEAIARIDRSLETIAERAGARGASVARLRIEDALRELADQRVDGIKRALVAAGVPEEVLRVRPARVHHVHDLDPLPGGAGRVSIEVVP